MKRTLIGKMPAGKEVEMKFNNASYIRQGRIPI
ncbi:hypothetical protein J2Z52_001694 [Enterococcus rivorum]|nr:hypothetical protein [Enterococcus rivorum]